MTIITCGLMCRPQTKAVMSVTATFGGIIRDALGGESPVVLRREIYVTAAFASRWLRAGGSEDQLRKMGM